MPTHETVADRTEHEHARSAAPEPVPSSGFRAVYAALCVDPDIEPAALSSGTARAVCDDSRTRRNRRKHALEVSS